RIEVTWPASRRPERSACAFAGEPSSHGSGRSPQSTWDTLWLIHCGRGIASCSQAADASRAMDRRALETDALLAEITSYCREAKVAESTFGRLAVNDGKFVSRLRNGSRVTSDTVQRVRAYMARHGSAAPIETHQLPA